MAPGLAMAFAAIAYFVQGFGGEFQTVREFPLAQAPQTGCPPQAHLN